MLPTWMVKSHFWLTLSLCFKRSLRFICLKIDILGKHIFTGRMVSHEDSFWHRGERQLWPIGCFIGRWSFFHLTPTPSVKVNFFRPSPPPLTNPIWRLNTKISPQYASAAGYANDESQMSQFHPMPYLILYQQERQRAERERAPSFEVQKAHPVLFPVGREVGNGRGNELLCVHFA